MRELKSTGRLLKYSKYKHLSIAKTSVVSIFLYTSFAASAFAIECRLALVLAVDVSLSVDDEEYRTQMGGLADALRTPEVRKAIMSPTGTGIAALAFEWSGSQHQRIIADWAMLSSDGDISAFANQIEFHKRTANGLATAVGSALHYAVRQFRRAPSCVQRTIDVSGDGPLNDGPPLASVRQKGLLAGFTINGLVVKEINSGALFGESAEDPANYYTTEVIQGPGSFIEIADGYMDYARAIKRKLIRELSMPLYISRSYNLR